MPALQSIDLQELLKDVPRGAWVAVSKGNDRVLAYGFDLLQVLSEAKRRGESDLLVVRVPEGPASLLI